MIINLRSTTRLPDDLDDLKDRGGILSAAEE